jgi:dienelactone hydrolase
LAGLTWRPALAALALLAGFGAAQAQREFRLSLPLSAQSKASVELPAALPVTLWLPAGAGPFPLALIHHERRFFTEGPPRYEAAARYFLARGYAVAVPTRVGYGELSKEGDREHINCGRPHPGRVLADTTVQAAAVLEGLSAQGQPIDRERVVHVGVGVGGLAALAAANLSPFGARAAVNFGGVLGAYPERFPGRPCGVEATRNTLIQLGRAARKNAADQGQVLPTLWLYARNDLHVLPEYARRWHSGYRRSGGASQLSLLDDWAQDGSRLFEDGVERWQPLLDEFLQSHGLPAQPLKSS